MALALYYYDTCPFCQYVLDIIEQLKIEETIIFKNIYKEQKYMLELIEMNGHRQVPCLVIDGEPMLESVDIHQFLASKFAPF